LFDELFYVDLPRKEELTFLGLDMGPLSTAPEVAELKKGENPTMQHDVAAPSRSKRSAKTAALDGGEAALTEEEKLERRERNREHAKRSRMRKKFLLDSLQDQIHGLEDQISGLKEALLQELPDNKACEIIESICGNKEKFTPFPVPSGFGPVKTLMEPDCRLMSALSGSHQNFAISDPTLPDNPIVYVSQGFLDLTGYTIENVLGRNCRFLQGPGTDQSAVAIMRKGILEGVDTSVCLLNYRADGTPFWNQVFVAALRDGDNKIVNYVGVQCEVSKAVVDKHSGKKQEKENKLHS
jgi:PAS domain S-box-containing protein